MSSDGGPAPQGGLCLFLTEVFGKREASTLLQPVSYPDGSQDPLHSENTLWPHNLAAFRSGRTEFLCVQRWTSTCIIHAHACTQRNRIARVRIIKCTNAHTCKHTYMQYVSPLCHTHTVGWIEINKMTYWTLKISDMDVWKYEGRVEVVVVGWCSRKESSQVHLVIGWRGRRQQRRPGARFLPEFGWP